MRPRFAVLLPLLLLALASVAASGRSVSNPDDDRRVVGIRTFTLNPGIAPAHAERHVREEFGRIYSERLPGTRVYLMRAERGAQAGTYQIVVEFESLRRRNEYFPQPDVASERVERERPKLEAAFAALEKFGKMSPSYTDYIVLD